MYYMRNPTANFGLIKELGLGAAAGSLWGLGSAATRAVVDPEAVNSKEFRNEVLTNTGGGIASGVGVAGLLHLAKKKVQ